MLRCEQLEARDTPAATAYGDFLGDGGEYRAEAAAGGRVAVYDVSYRGPEAHPAVLVGEVEIDPGFTGELRVSAADVAGGPAQLVVAPGAGGGPRVTAWEWSHDLGRFVQTSSVFVYSEHFRGGIAEGGLLCHDIDFDGTDEVLAIAGEGGSPHLVGHALDGTRVLSVYVGPTDDRAGEYRFAPAGEGLRGYSPDPTTAGLVIDRGEPDPVTWEVEHGEFFSYAGDRYDWADVGHAGFYDATPLPAYT